MISNMYSLPIQLIKNEQLNPKSNLKSNFVNTSDYSIYNSGLNLLSFHETDKLSSHMQRDIRVYDIESFSNAKSKITQMANEVNKKFWAFFRMVPKKLGICGKSWHFRAKEVTS